jgi:hypothetical protein
MQLLELANKVDEVKKDQRKIKKSFKEKRTHYSDFNLPENLFRLLQRVEDVMQVNKEL